MSHANVLLQPLGEMEILDFHGFRQRIIDHLARGERVLSVFGSPTPPAYAGGSPSDAGGSYGDTAEDAPRTMVEKYGSANGFGWKMGDIVTAQIVSVPMQLPQQRARETFKTFMISLAAVFVILLIATNGLLIFMVTRPVNRLSSMASSVSLGKSDIAEFPVTGKDEISELSKSFNRMARSLIEAMKMLSAEAR